MYDCCSLKSGQFFVHSAILAILTFEGGMELSLIKAWEERNMKPEEAIDIIKRMYKGTPTTEQYEALEAAYEALGKQIPKETPRIYGAMGEKYECPECGSGLRDTDLFAGYCKWCGQAIKQY